MRVILSVPAAPSGSSCSPRLTKPPVAILAPLSGAPLRKHCPPTAGLGASYHLVLRPPRPPAESPRDDLHVLGPRRLLRLSVSQSQEGGRRVPESPGSPVLPGWAPCTS